MSFSFTKDDTANLTLEQKVAIMESLTIAVIADGQAPKSETDQFDREVEAIEWGVDKRELIELLTEVRTRVLALASEDDAVALINSVTARLVEPGLREKTFRAMAAIMYADGEMANAELSVLGGYATNFQIPRDRFAAIKADVIKAPTEPI